MWRGPCAARCLADSAPSPVVPGKHQDGLCMHDASFLPPVMKMTLPSRDGMSVAGLKSAFASMAPMMTVVATRRRVLTRKVPKLVLRQARGVWRIASGSNITTDAYTATQSSTLYTSMLPLSRANTTSGSSGSFALEHVEYRLHAIAPASNYAWSSTPFHVQSMCKT
jgi:hypothetical protein